MKKGFLLLCCLFLCLNFRVKADTGCRVPGNRIYTLLGSKGYYDNIPYTDDYCSWVPDALPNTCEVCKTSLLSNGNCTGGPSNRIDGVKGTFTPIPCPLDDYIPFLIFAIGGLGFFYLRRKDKSISAIR